MFINIYTSIRNKKITISTTNFTFPCSGPALKTPKILIRTECHEFFFFFFKLTTGHSFDMIIPTCILFVVMEIITLIYRREVFNVLRELLIFRSRRIVSSVSS